MFSYIHIPFCESKCKYCRFASIGNVNKILVKKYLSHLVSDIKNFTYLTPAFKKTGVKLKSVYFWWWTPSILKENELQKILQALQKKFWFEKDIEITLETTPKNLTKENIFSWEKLGINRISIWIQTLNNKTLKEIARDEKKIILEWLKKIETSRIKNISVDFIIWLPYIKPWEILQDIKYILEKYDFIKHISVYMLEDYYETSPINSFLTEDRNNKFEKIVYPKIWEKLWLKEDEYIKEYLEIKSFLEIKWFFRYELSNFSKFWYQCQHNKAYWNHSEVVWFWLGSHSFINNVRYAYKDDFLGYYSKKLEYEDFLNEEDIILEKIMFWIRTSWINRKNYEKLNQIKIQNFIDSWILEIKNENLVIRDNFISLVDKILLEIT